jgi:hypothetical protein
MIPLNHESAVGRFACEELGADFPDGSEIARALETFCELHCGYKALTSDYLSLLLSRALVKSGRAEAARHILRRHLPGADACLPALAQNVCPHRMISCLSAKLVRATRWVVAGDAPVWVVDLRRLKQDALAGIELGLLPAIRALLEEAAPLWDASAGRGYLGLRGADFPGVPSGGVGSFCRDWLDLAARRRGWSASPELLFLDGGG